MIIHIISSIGLGSSVPDSTPILQEAIMATENVLIEKPNYVLT